MIYKGQILHGSPILVSHFKTCKCENDLVADSYEYQGKDLSTESGKKTKR